MIEIIPAPSNVAAFRVVGTVTAEDYDAVIPAVEKKLSDHQDIGVLADLTQFEDMTAGALRRDLQYALSKLGDFHRFKRAAVISDKEWIKAVAGFASAFVPQIEARVFPQHETDAAMEWVAGVQ